MKPIGIVVFLGTQCDQDTKKSLQAVGLSSQFLWYEDRFKYKDFSAIILPGGFSYGDYLRSGVLAAQSPVMKSVYEASQKGYPILGICNGFQILCEAGLLPGTLTLNSSLKFIDQMVELKRIETSPYWGGKEETPRFPIDHSEGRYFHTKEGVEELRQKEQVWYEYKQNPNGSVENIAGIFNLKKNVAGLMPHPERAMETWMKSTDGIDFFREFLNHNG